MSFKNIKYSLFTLNPKDISDRKKFRLFKISEMSTSVIIYAIFALSSCIFNGGNLITNQSKSTLINFLVTIFGVMLSSGVFLIGKRYKEAIVYLLPVHRIILSGLFLMALPELESEKEGDNFQQLMAESVYFIFAYITDTTLFAPSLFFTALIYGPIYATTHLI